jgi:hypothetical protein
VTDWILNLQKGDVIESTTGVLRIVRNVHRWTTRRGNVHVTVTLAIRKPSWTGRPYTVINGHDLRWQGYKPTGAKWPLDSEFDRSLEASFGTVPFCGMSARDVLGVA